MLKKISDNRANKQAIDNYTAKIATLQAEKQQLLSETLINTS
jgi:hypothetical protein